MKVKLVVLILALLSGSALKAVTHHFVNATDYPLSIDVNLLWGPTKKLTLNPGERENMDVYGYTVEDIKAKTLFTGDKYLNMDPRHYEGKRTTRWAGLGTTFRFYTDRQWDQIVIIRQGENNALSDYDKNWKK